MELVRYGVETLVLVVGLCGWVICIPQFKLLLYTKCSRSNSLFLSTGGLFFQVIFFANALLQHNVVFAISLGTGLINGIVMLGFVLYYRVYPGGKAKAPASALGPHLQAGKAPTQRRTGKSPARHPTRMRAELKVYDQPPQRFC